MLKHCASLRPAGEMRVGPFADPWTIGSVIAPPWISGAELACDSPPERLGGFVQRLLPGHADVLEQVRIIGEFAERRALSTPSGPSPQDSRARSPI
jgi:hypothetical protein